MYWNIRLGEVSIHMAIYNMYFKMALKELVNKAAP